MVEDGWPAVMNRFGCASFGSLSGKKPCDLAKLDWQVLQVQPGLWRLIEMSEQTAYIGVRKIISARLPLGLPVKVGPGEVVYIGDLVLSADYDAPSVSLRRHGRDDAAAQRALAGYPGLRNAPIVFKDPQLRQLQH